MVLEKLIRRSELADIYDKVAAGQRIGDDDALRLYRSRNLTTVGVIADIVRERKNGNRASYILNRYLNYSNICILSCQFCEFGKKKRDAEAFELTIEQMIERVANDLRLGITEVHVVGGLHPSLPFSYYTDMVRALKALDPKLHIKAFTAVELYHFASLTKKPLAEILAVLRDAGLDSITGGGAEIFSQRVRDILCKGKETADEYLDCHRAWHRMGMHSTCTMLYGHIETLEERVDHLRRLRELQDETHGFTSFVPLHFVPDKTKLAHITPASGFDDLRNLAIGRIYLDNFDHITGYWIALGMKLAQVSLSFGVDDLHGTIMEERIFEMAGGCGGQQQTRDQLEHAIREAGRIPVQRDSLFRPIKVSESGAEPVQEVTA
ncbi:MAG: aminofutalosine synthase MqnE [Verrucomicrobia bacterium GWF2_62_7]|nr:MAG: aminofutalosine synthase MqnE [Verrucomicrobia bacterium GWF2_62_7]